jgi:3-methyl-2-oxobutanoate hydroxymethyltransferase
VQGREADSAEILRRDARLLQEAGCFALVVEAIPASLTAQIQADLTIPVSGIGAGSGCDGQVLVLHDLLGLSGAAVPRYVKRYADLAGTSGAALESYVNDVRTGRFPGPEHSYGG